MELQLVKPARMLSCYTLGAKNSKGFSIKSSIGESMISPSKSIQKCSEKDLSLILRKEAAVKNIERKSNSSKYNNLSPKAVLDALDEAIRGKQWEFALKIFGLLRKQHWYVPKSQTYAKLLVMLGKCRQPDQASLLFEIMESDGLQPTIDIYTALVGVYGLNGNLEKAFDTVNYMKSASNCKPDVYTYSILIKCCAKLGQFDMVGDVLAEMSYLGVECSTTTYNTLIDAYGKAGLFEDMERTLTEIMGSGTCLPDIFTFNAVVGSYGLSGQIEKAESWFDQFQLMGVKPDIITYNILIKSYGKAGLYRKMGAVLDFMKKRFYAPTIVTYNIVIDTFGKSGNVEKMEEFFLKMKHQGMKPNSVTYCSLVNAYSKYGLMDKVDSILRQVENSDVVLDTPFYNCIISAYGQAGDILKMAELFMSMKDRKCKPDDITFASMIQAYHAQGMTEAAQNLEAMMITDGDVSGTLLIRS